MWTTSLVPLEGTCSCKFIVLSFPERLASLELALFFIHNPQDARCSFLFLFCIFISYNFWRLSCKCCRWLCDSTTIRQVWNTLSLDTTYSLELFEVLILDSNCGFRVYGFVHYEVVPRQLLVFGELILVHQEQRWCETPTWGLPQWLCKSNALTIHPHDNSKAKEFFFFCPRSFGISGPAF